MLVWVPDLPWRDHLGELPASVEVGLFPAEGPPPPEARDVEFLVPPWTRRRVEQVLPAMTGLRVIQTLTAGVDWLVRIVPPGVTLCKAAGVHDAAVVEWTVGAILATVKRFPEYRDHQRDGRWRPDWQDDLEGRTVLILGYGSIGASLEARLSPFQVSFVRVARRAREGVASIDDLPGLLPEADVVVVLVPLTPETRGMVDADVLARMKEGALLVNVARGPVVDTDALVAELASGRLRAALDVTDPEPLPEGHPLWSAPNVFVTPHVAGSTPRSMEKAFRFAGDQVRRSVSGEPLLHVVRDGY